MHTSPLAIDDGVLERLEELGALDDELGAIDEELRGTDEGAAELGATLERALLARLLVLPLKLVASFEVALMPLALLIR